MHEIEKEPAKWIRVLGRALLVFILISSAALAIFVLTFDANRYRPLIAEKLQAALGMPVELEKISLGWHNGLALDLAGLTLFQALPSRAEFLRLNSAAVRVSPLPFLRHELQISSVILENPEITLTRTPEGKLQEFSKPLRPASRPAAAPPVSPAPASASAALAFLVDLVKIKNGSLHFIDQSPKSPVDLWIQKIDLTVKNISLTKPTTVDARAALFSDKQNVSLDGKIRLLPEEQGIIAQDFSGNIDLASLDAARLLKTFPSLRPMGLAKGTSGQLEGKINRLKLAAGKIQELDGDLRLEQGSFKTGQMPLPLENVTLDAHLSPDRLVLQTASGSLGSGRLGISGSMENFQSSNASAQMDGSATGLVLSELAPAENLEEPHWDGILSLTLRGAAQGRAGAALPQTFTGSGQLDLKEGALRNLNLLREVFNKLSLIPGVVQSLEKHLPQGYDEKLKARDTVFAPLQVPVVIQHGNLLFDQALIQSESFNLLMSGRVSLEGTLHIEAVLTIDKDFSRAMMASVRELQYLADPEGRLQIPLVIQGPGSSISVFPNLQYVAAKLAVSKTREVLTGLLQKKESTPVEEQTPPVPSSGAQDFRKIKGRDLLNQFLKTALESGEKQPSR